MSDNNSGIELRITNEFAEAVVNLVPHGNGTRLRVQAPRAGREILIDAVVLEAIASVAADDLTAVLVSTVPGNERPAFKEGLHIVTRET
ncbi:hypothetical protein [Rhodococcus sp. USK13]|uniref:hypothetical protein n=1 Tax=Rhodococcus sp. USK13 TaxID=2806442 RepID=UPI001BD0B2E7|nr:hypothetical protein [Rhodococcus sp. USK13]